MTFFEQKYWFSAVILEGLRALAVVATIAGIALLVIGFTGKEPKLRGEPYSEDRDRSIAEQNQFAKDRIQLRQFGVILTAGGLAQFTLSAIGIAILAMSSAVQEQAEIANARRGRGLPP